MVWVSDIAIHCQFPLQSLVLVSSVVVENDMQVLEHHPSFPLEIYLAAVASKHSKQKQESEIRINEWERKEGNAY